MEQKKRRVAGEGTIYQRKNGTYAAIYRGKYAYAKTRAEAAEKLDAMKAEAKEEKPNAITMKAALDIWVHYKRLSLKPTSYDRLEQMVCLHIIPRVGDMPCSEFTEDVFIKNILSPMRDAGLSYSSAKKAQDAVRAFCRWASAPTRRYMLANPMETFDSISRTSFAQKSRQQDVSDIVYLDEAQRERFIDACHMTWKTGNARYPHGEALIFAMYTGLRMGELLALKWADVDLRKKFIRVAAEVSLIIDRDDSANSHAKRIIVRNEYTKTNKPRLVPLGKPALESITRIKDMGIDGSEYVVHNRHGEIVSPITLSTTMSRICELANIELRDGTNVHALRHTFASMCFAAKMPVRVVSELLGHSSVQITMDTYIHLIQANELLNVPELDTLK